MREILFRGKSVLANTWVYGYPVTKCYGCVPIMIQNADCDDVGCVEFDYAHIEPETIGQYTGLTDKNGKKIFEGDIIKFDWHGGKKSVVTFENGMFKAGDTSLMTWCHIQCKCEVIGNTTDNPELLEGIR